jgi:hypothetical protein
VTINDLTVPLFPLDPFADLTRSSVRCAWKMYVPGYLRLRDGLLVPEFSQPECGAPALPDEPHAVPISSTTTDRR